MFIWCTRRLVLSFDFILKLSRFNQIISAHLFDCLCVAITFDPCESACVYHILGNIFFFCILYRINRKVKMHSGFVETMILCDDKNEADQYCWTTQASRKKSKFFNSIYSEKKNAQNCVLISSRLSFGRIVGNKFQILINAWMQYYIEMDVQIIAFGYVYSNRAFQNERHCKHFFFFFCMLHITFV